MDRFLGGMDFIKVSDTLFVCPAKASEAGQSSYLRIIVNTNAAVPLNKVLCSVVWKNPNCMTDELRWIELF